MRRSEAARRHRRSVVIIAAMAGALVVLLYAVVPRVEAEYAERGIDPPPAAGAIFRVSGLVVDQIAPVLLLVAC